MIDEEENRINISKSKILKADERETEKKIKNGLKNKHMKQTFWC